MPLTFCIALLATLYKHYTKQYVSEKITHPLKKKKELFYATLQTEIKKLAAVRYYKN